MQTDKDRDALLRGLKKYNALLPSPIDIASVKIAGMDADYPIRGMAGFVWLVSYGYWHGYGDTIMGAANDAASKMPNGPLTAAEVKVLRAEVDALDVLAREAWDAVDAAKLVAALATTRHRVARDAALAKMQGRRP